MNSQLRKRNLLTLAPATFEERVLYSATTIEAGLQAVAALSNGTAADPSPVHSTAPVVASAITSSNSLEVRERTTVLRVLGSDDQREKFLTYTWHVESAPEGANTKFHTNGSNRAKNVIARFDQVGSYTFRVDITDQDGQTVSDRIQIDVIPVATDIVMTEASGRRVYPKSFARVDGSEKTLTATVNDQFGKPLAKQPTVQWQVEQSPTGSSPVISTKGNTASVVINRTGTYRVQAKVDDVVVSTRLESTERLSSLELSLNGKRIETGDVVQSSSLNPNFTVVGFDQFGQRMATQPKWVWTTASKTQSAVPKIADLNGPHQFNVNKLGISQLRVRSGAQSVDFTLEVTPATGKSIFVNNASELTTALSQAESGDTILLKGGVNYGILSINKPTNPFAGPVTIKSADPKQLAIFESVNFANAQNITLDNVRVVTEKRYAAITISGSKNIEIKNSEVTANLDPYRADQSMRRGVDLRFSSDISFVGNVFQRLTTAFGMTNSSKVLIDGNTFQENLKDNLNIGSNVSDVTVRGNTFHSQVAKLFPEHHYDNIQLWVQTDATQNSRNITITQNTIYDMTGVVHSQAIFGRGDYVDADGVDNPYGFENVEVSHNVIVTQHANAIAFSDAHGLRIHHNTLVYAGKDYSDAKSVYVPRVIAPLSTDVVISENILPNNYSYPQADNNVFHENTYYDIASGALAEILVNPYATQPTRNDFATLSEYGSDQRAATSYRGALVLVNSTQRPVAQFTYEREVENGKFVYTFDASASLPVQGLDLQDAKFQWRFADGTTATGVQVEKSFAKAGSQDIQLTVIDRLGRQHTFVKQGVTIRDTSAVALDFEGSIADATSTVSKIAATGNPTFVPRSVGGTAVVLGGDQGHLYLSPSDPDLGQMIQTKQFTFATAIQANANENSRSLSLLTNHGAWSLMLDPSGSVRFNVGKSTIRFDPGTNLMNGKWNEVAVTVTGDSFSFFVNGSRVYKTALTQAQSDSFFAGGSYGIGIGGSGPWFASEATRYANKFQLDNLNISTVALSDQQIAARAWNNSVVA